MTLAGDPGLLTSQGQWEDLFVWYDEQRGVWKMIMHGRGLLAVARRA